MKNLSVRLQAVGHRLVSLLIGKWGLPLLLVGMTALAGSTAIYLTSNYQSPQAGVTATGVTALIADHCASHALPLRSTDIRIGCP